MKKSYKFTRIYPFLVKQCNYSLFVTFIWIQLCWQTTELDWNIYWNYLNMKQLLYNVLSLHLTLNHFHCTWCAKKQKLNQIVRNHFSNENTPIFYERFLSFNNLKCFNILLISINQMCCFKHVTKSWYGFVQYSKQFAGHRDWLEYGGV